MEVKKKICSRKANTAKPPIITGKMIASAILVRIRNVAIIKDAAMIKKLASLSRPHL
jgi:hypothetical protein